MSLSENELQRYERHLSLPDVGIAGQERLKQSSILIVGAGGLGSPAAMYLTAAGIGRIGIVDADVVELSNLQRQILHTTPEIGKRKTDSARDMLNGINPEVVVETHKVRIEEENAQSIFEHYDIVIDGSDNFPTRFVISEACSSLGKPHIYGSVFRFEGQVSVFDSRRGPCYRCLHPEPPPAGLVPDCTVGGVIGVLPGIVGSIQAAEAIKACLQVGKGLIGRMLLIDIRDMTFRELELNKNPECRGCGVRKNQPIQRTPSTVSEDEAASDISVEELKSRNANGDILVLDVREPHEYEIARIASVLIPLQQLPNRFEELDKTKEIVTLCHHGFRSAHAAAFLRSQGFQRVRNLAGGIDAWSARIDPTIPRY